MYCLSGRSVLGNDVLVSPTDFSNMETLLQDQGIMRHLTQMTETIQKTEELKSELSMQEARKQMLQRQQEAFQQAIVIEPGAGGPSQLQQQHTTAGDVPVGE